MTNRKLYNNILRIISSIREQRMLLAGHCWKSKNELDIDVLLLTPEHGEHSSGRPANKFVDQMLEDTECEIEELIHLMDNRDKL